MRSVLIVSILVIQAYGASFPENTQANIVKYENNNDGTGNYEFRFLTSNGIQRSETGKLVNVGQPDEHIEIQGEFSYNDPDGKVVLIRYTAGENGYQVLTENEPIFDVPEELPAGVVASLLG